MIDKCLVDYDNDFLKQTVPVPCHTKTDVNNGPPHCQSVISNEYPRSRCNRRIVVMLIVCSILWVGLLVLAVPLLSQAGLGREAGDNDPSHRRTALFRGVGDASSPETQRNTVGDRLAALERLSTGLATRVERLEKRNRELELVLANSDPTEPQQSEVLQQLVDQLERGMTFLFPDFQAVAADETRQVDPGERAMKARLEILRDYLGNREGELAVMRPDLAAWETRRGEDGEEDLDIDLGTVGLALRQLSQQNTELSKEVEELRRQQSIWQRHGDSNGGMEEANVLREVVAKDSQELNYLDEAERAKISDTRKSAFSVASSQPQLGLQGQMQFVTFDHNIANKGGDFYFSNNSFTCRIPGFYFFTFTLRTYDFKYLSAVLMKNDLAQVAINTDLADRTVSSTQTAILRLSVGDSVWLRIPPSENCGIYSDGAHYTTFSGFLVYGTTS